MAENLSSQVRECLRHAEDCVQQAASQTDPKLRRNYLIIGACWLKLSYELSDQPAPQRSDAGEGRSGVGQISAGAQSDTAL